MRQLTTIRRNEGFTYLALLLTIVIMGVVLGVTAEIWHTTVQRDKERELLFVGNQFRVAIRLYYLNHATLPHNLEDLIKDPQQAATRRYLRKIYCDPITGRNEWGVVRIANGGIIGIHSLSELQPLKNAGFGMAGSSFEGAVKYSEWMFLYLPRQIRNVQQLKLNSTGKNPF